MIDPPNGLLHGLVPVHGVVGAVLDVVAFLALLLAIFGLVLLFEDGPEGLARWGWVLGIVFVPILGPLAYLYARRSDGTNSAR